VIKQTYYTIIRSFQISPSKRPDINTTETKANQVYTRTELLKIGFDERMRRNLEHVGMIKEVTQKQYEKIKSTRDMFKKTEEKIKEKTVLKKIKSKPATEYEFTSALDNEKHHVEQIHDYKTNKSKFCIYDKLTKEVTEADLYEQHDVYYKPISGAEITERVVILPTEPLEYVSDEELDEEIRTHIRTWLDIPKDYETTAIYNIKLSWVYQKFHTINYTRALGDTGTGKSRFLDVLGLLHYKPMMVAGNLTPAVIFRLINKWRGTLIIDECDQDKSDETNAFIKIMNCGYEKGRAISRCDKNDPNKIDFFYVYGCKVITTRKRFTDKATEARCMTAIMSETTRTDIKEVLTQQFFDKTTELRNKLLMWRFRNYDLIDPDAGNNIDLVGIEPRLRQVNRAFLSLIAHSPEKVEAFKLKLKEYQENILYERAMSFEGRIINALANLIYTGSKEITPTCVKDYLTATGEEFQYNLTSMKISKVLQGCGLNFRRNWSVVSNGTKNMLVINWNDISVIFKRYVTDDKLKDYVFEKLSETKKCKIEKNVEKTPKKSHYEHYGDYGLYADSKGLVSKNKVTALINDFNKFIILPKKQKNSSSENFAYCRRKERNMRNECNVDIDKKIEIHLRKVTSEDIDVLKEWTGASEEHINELLKIGDLMYDPKNKSKVRLLE
jgi:hypothetical protein